MFRDMNILKAACVAILLLTLPVLAIGPGSTNNCQGKHQLIADAEVDSYGWPRVGDCGPYKVGGTRYHCRNLRKKLYYRCDGCRNLHRENTGTTIGSVDGTTCPSDHLGIEDLKPPLLDLLSNFGRVHPSASSAPGPSNSGK
ncbi:uncharacterized protein PGTG_05772 [Puccinia graminis f. sp. tritici CRL 75-36-700-3]|uniref:Secreted protein n=1 Tax=Puccinia graminis f. sp. tritici (strain CRL 75-36-700-3 / race SCCL) TaxID=418459 RepID=E3K5G5_PUCGT|nr:uncharacterized protein PGTG_05772 [Puccinia graminis f. sp. tritici CRL 75-36-700-3]EFP79451.2 hypothetical protein PGTG_05772 [Puccinia graminis f. sp. tritici CRL 75-36-700-3]